MRADIPEFIRCLPAVARRSPSGENATSLICQRVRSVTSSRVAMFCCVRTSHNLKVQSSPPLASNCPSGENATELICRVCPLRVDTVPFRKSHNLIVSVSPALAINELFTGENFTALNGTTMPKDCRFLCKARKEKIEKKSYRKK